jgi:hypothetical protein
MREMQEQVEYPQSHLLQLDLRETLQGVNPLALWILLAKRMEILHSLLSLLLKPLKKEEER